MQLSAKDAFSPVILDLVISSNNRLFTLARVFQSGRTKYSQLLRFLLTLGSKFLISQELWIHSLSRGISLLLWLLNAISVSLSRLVVCGMVLQGKTTLSLLVGALLVQLSSSHQSSISIRSHSKHARKAAQEMRPGEDHVLLLPAARDCSNTFQPTLITREDAKFRKHFQEQNLLARSGEYKHLGGSWRVDSCQTAARPRGTILRQHGLMSVHNQGGINLVYNTQCPAQ